MAVTGRKKRLASMFAAGLLLAAPLLADPSSDLRATLQHIATGLTDENPADAMKPFARSLRDYDKLSDYFNGLTSSYQITNEVDVVDEQDSPDQVVATVAWTLTLSDKTNPGVQDSRYRQIHVRVVREQKDWKVVEFSPIDLFNPRFHPRSEHPPQ